MTLDEVSNEILMQILLHHIRDFFNTIESCQHNRGRPVSRLQNNISSLTYASYISRAQQYRGLKAITLRNERQLNGTLFLNLAKYAQVCRKSLPSFWHE